MKETEIDAKSVNEVMKERGFTEVRLRRDVRSSNKFLGSENPRTAINPNGYDPVQRAADAAKEAATRRLQEVMDRHEDHQH